MDTTASNIIFDSYGNCNFCSDLIDNSCSMPSDKSLITNLVDKIKSQGQYKEYDCIIGLSGGIDSSYVLLQAVKYGLRPLAVHLDNGWNSELAVDNIKNLVSNLNVDLYTHVIDWEENRDLQLSFFKANVLDIELLMDNAMLALNYKMARKYKLKYILAGTNKSTEGMRMPTGWNWLKFDKRNILSIHDRFGSRPIITHPLISVLDFVRYEFLQGIHWTPFLDYLEFRKDIAVEQLKEAVGYRPYPYKHYESVFTRFYQGFILPKKFGIDKRKLHLSTLIITGQISRHEALEIMHYSPYNSPSDLKSDYEFVLKKLGLSPQYFEDYLNSPMVDHSFYGSEKALWDFLKSAHAHLGLRRK